jgi:hypothetical protein
MEISPKFLGLSINDGQHQYEFSYMPFTQSSKLTDSNGNLVAELKRFGWFTLNFKLIAEDSEYLLKCRALNNELTTPQGETFQTGSSVNFANETKPLTKLTHDNRFKKYATLEVFSKHHRIALIIASCLFTVRYLHGGNYS